MRYALRNQEKIAAAYSPQYLSEHINKSLSQYFLLKTDKDITSETESPGEASKYPLLRVNDLADSKCMLEFAIIGKKYDVLRLAFCGRIKE